MIRLVLALSCVAALAACDQAGGNPAFRESGEIIALGGGDAGARMSCMSCHGLAGEGDGGFTPRLAALDPGYIERQLDDYANGRRDHGLMRAVARRLSGDARSKVAAYYAGLPATGATFAPVSAFYTARCAACHGADGEGGGPGTPPLAGQPPAYAAAQLEAWRSGRRRDPLDVMGEVSRALTSAEVRDLAARDGVSPATARRSRVPAASR